MRISVYLTHPTVACFSFGEAQLRRLAARLPGAEIRRTATEAEFLESLAQAEVALVWGFEQGWLERAPRLQWIVTPAAGRDYFQIEPREGLTVEYSGFHGALIGETVLAMLLGHCRGLFLAERLRGADPWPRAALSRSMRTLRGAHVTILGFGAIGRWIGGLAKPFGARLTGVSRGLGEPPEYFDASDRLLAAAQLDECLPSSDFLVLALPATRETDGLLDARRIALLPAHAALVNVGRGNAVDEDALATALSAGRLGGAYLDVYATEPLPASSALRRAPNAFLFPHAAAIAPQYLDLFVDEFAAKFERRYGRPDRDWMEPGA